jgi:methylated-DNA-[protein]-cysteine S-methyltransferase
MTMTFYIYYNTPAGLALLTSNGSEITGFHWEVFKRAPKPLSSWVENEDYFQEIIAQMDEYFTGRRQEFDLPFKIEVGTDFQKAVWTELAKVSFGVTRTYGEIAAAIGRPNAVRAVGHAVGSNPISIIVPCHRILAAGNKINGYAGGLEAKALLLGIEKSSYLT